MSTSGERSQQRKLILVRHSTPEIEPQRPASQWRLSDEGRLRCRTLVGRLAAYHPTLVVTSTEPKAIETGQIVAQELGIPCKIAEGLHEHERSGVGWGSREEFLAQVALLFERPSELVFGDETADQAHNRFAKSIASVVQQIPEGNLAVVSHGTVMTLFISRAAGLDPFPFWRRLSLPAFAVLSLPDFDLLQVVENAEPHGDDKPQRQSSSEEPCHES